MELGVIAKGLFKKANTTRLADLANGHIANDNPVLRRHVALADISSWVAEYHAFHQWQHSHWHPCIAQVLSLDLQMHCLTQQQSAVPLLGLVHIANRIQWLAPITAQNIDLECQIHAFKWHRKGVVLTLRTQLTQLGEVVVIADSDYLYRSKLRASDDNSTMPASEIQTMAEPQKLSLDKGVGRRYAQLSGDYNPIHLWPLTAKLFGFKQPIAHGMHTLALCLTARYQAQSQWPGQRQLNAHFKAPASLPCELHLACEAEYRIATANRLALHNLNANEGQREVLSLFLEEL